MPESAALREFLQQQGAELQGEPPAVGNSPAGPVPAASPGPQQPQAPPAAEQEPLPVITNPEDVIDEYYRTHGRPPLEAEVRAIRALPIIARQLGRQPTKIELLAFLEGRDETPPPQRPEFTVG